MTHRWILSASLILVTSVATTTFLVSEAAAQTKSKRSKSKLSSKAKRSRNRRSSGAYHEVATANHRLHSPVPKIGRMDVVGPSGANGTNSSNAYIYRQNTMGGMLYRQPNPRVSMFRNQPWITRFRPGVTILDSTPSNNYVQAYGNVYIAPSYPSGTVALSAPGMRVGYYQYVPNFRANLFYYSNYRYNPGQAYYSPWYYYSNLPPYVSTGSLTVIPSYTSSVVNGEWTAYNATSPNPAVDGIINRLQATFQTGDPIWLMRLARSSGRIAIFMGGQYQYSVGATDFSTMLRDLVLGTQTTGYTVDQVQEWGDELRVQTTHQFIDSQGLSQIVRQVYVFGQDINGNLQILEFGTYA